MHRHVRGSRYLVRWACEALAGDLAELLTPGADALTGDRILLLSGGTAGWAATVTVLRVLLLGRITGRTWTGAGAGGDQGTIAGGIAACRLFARAIAAAIAVERHRRRAGNADAFQPAELLLRRAGDLASDVH